MQYMSLLQACSSLLVVPTKQKECCFFEDMLHELGTPFTLSFYALDELEELYPDDQLLKDLLKENVLIKNMLHAHYLLVLLDSITASEIQMHKVDVHKIIEGEISIFLRRYKDVSLEYNNTESFYMHAQADIILGLVNFFIYNSYHHCLENPASIQIDLFSDNEKLYLNFTDNGIGIDKDEEDLLVEKYYKTTRSKELEMRGAGLGLTIMNKIIQLFYGKLIVKSQNSGLKICLEFPLFKGNKNSI